MIKRKEIINLFKQFKSFKNKDLFLNNELFLKQVESEIANVITDVIKNENEWIVFITEYSHSINLWDSTCFGYCETDENHDRHNFVHSLWSEEQQRDFDYYYLHCEQICLNETNNIYNFINPLCSQFVDWAFGHDDINHDHTLIQDFLIRVILDYCSAHVDGLLKSSTILPLDIVNIINHYFSK